MTKQPEWEYITNLGDVNPLDYGGYFIFRDKTGIYPAEAEKYNPEDHTAFRITLDRMYLMEGHLIPFSIHMRQDNLPHPLKDYIEWFDDSIPAVASFVGMEKKELIKLFCSSNPLELARAYEALYDYHGWENGDGYPLTLTRKEAEKRYKDYK